MDTRKSLLDSYNQAAIDYADAFYDELQQKTFDQNLLRQFCKHIPEGTKVCDLGCGPGQLTEYLTNLGLSMIGIDLSDGMISIAKQRNPTIQFETGDMLDLHLQDGTFGGVAAFYSIIHTPPKLLSKAFSEIYRVLVPNGILLFSCHKGIGSMEVDDWFDKGIKYHCFLHESDELKDRLEKVGFSDITTQIRKPYDFEFQTERIYVTAFKNQITR